MSILGLLLIAFLARINAFDDYGYELWDPFSIDPQDWMEDPVRNKRDPLSIYLTYEKEGCGKNIDAPKIAEMGYNDEGKQIVKKLIRAGEIEGSASHKPTRITIVKNCKCKSKPNAPKFVVTQPVMPNNHPTHEDPFEKFQLSRNYPTPSLGERFNADESVEELKKKKDLWSMTSEELMSGSYSQPPLLDKKHQSSPMASIASKQFNSYPFSTRNPPYEVPKVPQQLPQVPHKLPQVPQLPQVPHQPPQVPQSPKTTKDQGYSYPSVLTGDLSLQEEKEHEIIHRIKSEYDLSHKNSDFDQQRRIKEAVLDFIKSKYPVRVPKKRILAESKLNGYFE